MARQITEKVNTNTPDLDYLLRIYGMGTAVHVSFHTCRSVYFEQCIFSF